MAGYQPSSATLTEQAWSIKDLVCGFRENFSCGTQRVVPRGQDSSILPAWVGNHSAGCDSSCPLAESNTTVCYANLETTVLS